MEQQNMFETPLPNVESLAGNDLATLRMLHRDIHDRLEEMIADPFANQLQISRLKREKLRVKDAIERLRSSMIPDLDA
jgi:hypothetical protein